MDKITIKDLAVRYRVGVTPKERRKPQRLLITVEIETHHRKAAESDKLIDTVDYFEVSEYLRKLGAGKEWNLIEATASEIADYIMKNPNANGVTVEIKKFVIPRTAHVSVTISRHRRSGV